jgi:hypothetical protein
MGCPSQTFSARVGDYPAMGPANVKVHDILVLRDLALIKYIKCLVERDDPGRPLDRAELIGLSPV